MSSLRRIDIYHLILWHSYSLSLIDHLSQHDSNDNDENNIDSITNTGAATTILNILRIASYLILTLPRGKKEFM